MSNLLVWQHPFSDAYGNGIVYRLFETAGMAWVVGFEQIETLHDLVSKGIDIQRACPGFQFPQNGVWAVVFDQIDSCTQQPQGYKHVRHKGIMGGRVLFNVASIIFDHYTVCHAAAYVFSAANDLEHQRRTDLMDLYCGLLGLNGCSESRLFKRFAGWRAYSDIASGGRGYVVTTKNY